MGKLTIYGATGRLEGHKPHACHACDEELTLNSEGQDILLPADVRAEISKLNTKGKTEETEEEQDLLLPPEAMEEE